MRALWTMKEDAAQLIFRRNKTSYFSSESSNGKTQHVMLVGDGAKKFALDYGFETSKTPIPEVKKIGKLGRKKTKRFTKNRK